MKKDLIALDVTYLNRIKIVTVCKIQSTSKGIGKKLCGVTQDSHEFSGVFMTGENWEIVDQ